MPQDINFIQCDDGEGRLEVIAQTQTHKGMQYGDPIESTFFYKCTHCQGIFYGNGASESDSVQASTIEPYDGQLTEQEIREFMPEEKGNFYLSDEDNIMAKSRPEKFERKVRVVEINGCAYASVPHNFIGQIVLVKGQSRESTESP